MSVRREENEEQKSCWSLDESVNLARLNDLNLSVADFHSKPEKPEPKEEDDEEVEEDRKKETWNEIYIKYAVGLIY